MKEVYDLCMLGVVVGVALVIRKRVAKLILILLAISTVLEVVLEKLDILNPYGF